MSGRVSRRFNVTRRTACVGAIVLATLLLIGESTAFAAAKTISRVALVVLLDVNASEAAARLASARATIEKTALPNMSIAVYALGVERGAQLVYLTVPALLNKDARLPRPHQPDTTNDLAIKIWTKKILKPWQEQDAKWVAKNIAESRFWTGQKTAGLVNSTVRSPSPLTSHHLKVGLFRAGQFFTHKEGTRVLVIFVTQMPFLPQDKVIYELDGALPFVAGWRTDRPEIFDKLVTAWTGFLRAHGVVIKTKLKVIPQGGNTDDIVKQINTSLANHLMRRRKLA